MFNIENYLYWVIGGAALLLILGIILLIFLFRGKKEPTILIDISEILKAIGANNILSIEQVQKRVRIQVKDTQIVDLETLKEVSNGIFVTGDRLVLTFKDNTEDIVKALRREIW